MSEKKKLLLFTDTYAEQVNGAKVTLEELVHHIWDDVELVIVSADRFLTVPFPTYIEVRFAIVTPNHISRIIKKEKPDMIHIVTEWTIGFAAARACKKLWIPYTSAFHTKFPEYIALRMPFIGEKYVHKALHYIHDGATRIIVSNNSMKTYLEENNYPKEKILTIPFWVDHSLFFPWEKTLFQDLPKPILLFVWRVAIEKNIGDFLSIESSGTKIVVGDGPLKNNLEKQFPQVHFLWKKTKRELAEIYRSADIFVFPSLTDTLGLVNIEALACGTPVVAYDVWGAGSIITHKRDGILVAYGKLLGSWIPMIDSLEKSHCTKTASNYDWWKYTEKFLEAQSPIPKTIWI